jgi:hypothetical protein
MLSLPTPRHLPCELCGASVATDDVAHTCDDERRLEFEIFQLRAEIKSFGRDLGDWLGTPRGRFECYYAERTRPD